MNLDYADQLIIREIMIQNYKSIPESVSQISMYLRERFPGKEVKVNITQKEGIRSIDVRIIPDTRPVEQKASELGVTVDYYMMEFGG